MGSNGYLDQNDQRTSVDSDHRHHQSRNSTGKAMLLNDSKSSSSSRNEINPRRHSSVISASPKITHNNNVLPTPNYLRASTGSCHDFCKFGTKKSLEEAKPWRCIRKQSPKVEIFPQQQADTSIIQVLPEKVDEDAATEKGKSTCEKIEAEKKIKVFNRKSTVAAVEPKPKLKPKPGISQKDIAIKNTERVEKKLVVDQPADFARIKPVIKTGKSLDVSKAPAAATSKKEKPPSPAAAAASRPNKLVSTNRLNGARNSSLQQQQQQQPVIKKRMVGIPEESKNNVKSKSLKKPVIKQILESEKNPAVESNENGYKIHEDKSNNENSQQKIFQIVESEKNPAVESNVNGYMIHEEESDNENSEQKMDQIVESEKNPAVESNGSGYMIHEEESNNENSQQKMDQIVESEENPSEESNENVDAMEMEELSEDDDETEEDEYEYEYENSITSQSSSEEEEDEKEETLNGGKRPKKIITEDNNGSEDGVKLKFRRGRVVDIEAEGKDSPRRLKFRQGRVENPAEGRSSSMKRHNFRKKTTKITNNNDPDSEIIMLRHQEIEEKKDAQGLFNNVIEETASKLVEARKSKVKALVGAFETVISLQETNTKHSSSPQTLIS